MAFDYKKEFKEFYSPKNKPEILNIPAMNFIAVQGKGDPNTVNGEYKQSIELLYGIAYTLKMSKMGSYKIKDYFDYVVPPLEGFWWQDNIKGVDLTRKDTFNWISMIRIPDFVTKKDFEWAIEEATIKKNKDFSKVEFLTLEEGLVVQCMHHGPFDDESATVNMMDSYALEQGYSLDFSDLRKHHEIYLTDPRKSAPEKLKTIIRHPIQKK